MDMYGTVEKQKLLVTVMDKLLEIWTDLLDQQKTPTSGEVLDIVPQLGNRGDSYKQLFFSYEIHDDLYPQK